MPFKIALKNIWALLKVKTYIFGKKMSRNAQKMFAFSAFSAMSAGADNNADILWTMRTMQTLFNSESMTGLTK
jgi:hypothetical protein